MATDLLSGFIGSGEVGFGYRQHLKGFLVDIPHELVVEGAISLRRVDLGQLSSDIIGTADVDAKAADGPELELDQALHEAQVCLGEPAATDEALADGDQPVFALHGYLDRMGGLFEVFPHPDTEGDEIRIEDGGVLDGAFDAEIIHVTLLGSGSMSALSCIGPGEHGRAP